jgi:uncharacterized phage-associated protein
MLRDWYHALLACDAVVELGALSQLGPAQAFLEDVLDVDGAPVPDTALADTDEPTSEHAAPTVLAAADVTMGVSSEQAMDYLRNAYLALASPVAGMGLLLMKILFLADAHMAVFHNTRLLDEIPQAWCKGPCYPKARNRFNATISSPTVPVCGLEPGVENVLSVYLHRYLRVRADDLVHAIHSTELWQSIPQGCDYDIRFANIQSSYRPLGVLAALLVEDTRTQGRNAVALVSTSRLGKRKLADVSTDVCGGEA